MKRLFNIAVVGSGGVAVRHVHALNALSSAKLAGIYNRTPENAARLAAPYNAPVFHSLNDLLTEPRVDAVLVLTNTETHFDYARQALEAGKHVLVEKPVAETAGQIRTLMEISQKQDRLCMPAHNYIYAPSARRLHAHLEAGRLGWLTSFWVLYNQIHPPEMGSADLMMRELMVHHAYTALRFAGRPTAVQATATNLHFKDSEAHDQIMITAPTSKGTIVNLWGSFAADDRTRDPWTLLIKAMGAKGTGAVSWDQIRFDDEPHPGWDDAAYWDSFYYIQKHFIKACCKKDKPLSDLADALDAHALLKAARVALETGKRVPVTYET